MRFCVFIPLNGYIQYPHKHPTNDFSTCQVFVLFYFTLTVISFDGQEVLPVKNYITLRSVQAVNVNRKGCG